MSVPSSRAHAALRATCVVYVCLGFGTSAWLSRLPDVRDDPVMTPARVSVLSTVNYGAALIGPPLLGLIADHIGYHRALAFVALPVLLAIVLAGQVPDRRGTKRTDLAFGD